MTGEEPVEMGVGQAPALGDSDPWVIRPEQVKVKTIGEHNWRRSVEDSIDSDVPATTLLVGETFNPR